MSRFKKIALIIFALVVVITAGIVYFVIQMEENLDYLMMTEIEEIDLSTIQDGHYIGEYDRLPLHVIVDVEISSHVITDITIVKHANGQGEAAEDIVEDVLLAQDLEVDAIAGATYSSKAILLAISDALTP